MLALHVAHAWYSIVCKSVLKWFRNRHGFSKFSLIFIGVTNQLGEFESGVTAAAFGAVGSVVLGGVGSMLIAAAWTRLFPDLARRDRMS